MKRPGPLPARVVALLIAWYAGAAAADDVVVTRAVELRADRYADAASLATLAPGNHVDLLKTDGGWVQVRAGSRTGWLRATGLTGGAASVASLATVRSGRDAAGNVVVAAGIRGIPKASRHALIVGVDAVDDGSGTRQRRPGAAYDVESARLIAQRIGVPPDNVEIVRAADATRDGIGSAIDRLDMRVQPGDSVLLYFSGPGTRVVEDGRCESAWVGADGATLTPTWLVERMKPSLRNADKVLMISDAAYRPEGAGPKGEGTAAVPSGPGCGSADASARMPWVEAAAASGFAAQNLVQMQSAPGERQGMAVLRAGGLFTEALLDCVLGDAVDSDRSASISVGELTACTNRPARGVRDPGPASRLAPLALATGNVAYAVLVGVAPPGGDGPPIPGGVTPGRAAIDDLLAQRDARIDVTMTATPTTLQIGRDALDLRLTSSHAGFVYLVLLGSDGASFSLLFPNDLDRDNRIAAGESLRLPRPNWRVTGQGPAGRDTVLAIVAESERDVTTLAARKDGPFMTALTDADGRARLQWLLGRSGQAESAGCVDGGKRRNLAVVRACSDAFGAAVVEVVER